MSSYYNDWLERFCEDFFETEDRYPTQAEINRATEMAAAQTDLAYETLSEDDERLS